MINQFSRTELLCGKEGMKRLKESRVAVFGIGGVGGYTAEALARSGIGELDLIDNDTVALTNLNRQIIALHSTLGRSKAEVMKERIADINPECRVNIYELFFDGDTCSLFDFTKYDYVVDAIDSVSSKLLLAELCGKCGTRIISSMGAGNKLHPELFEISDISKTSYDPLAKVMRRELKKRGIEHLTVVYSKEQPVELNLEEARQLLTEEELKKRSVPASNAFVPAAVGLIIASKVANDITGVK